ncbi:chlorite dismutase family protein [Saccharolobus islandicus]|uniref:Chlorite dismutase n=2 Tax=Saccharolobus islandicus TaxID=43080 RepID=C4KFM4_SACI6|nr:chlorite dismutase family protein [Sulfolobus islandicus]ACP56672.1 Chlorite dismutase [Sulfolobus islandicus M.16.27]ACR43358.1 Chlorite dismutase [Sulfolobus islandicus M.16.4]
MSQNSLAYFYISSIKLTNRWWSSSREERRCAINEIESVESQFRNNLISLKRYISLRNDSDIIYWVTSSDTSKLLEFKYTLLSKIRDLGYESLSLFSVYRSSPYTRGNFDINKVLSLEPLRYFVAYPMKKDVEWYLLPFEEREKIMKEHIETARTHPKNKGIRSYTTYSFGVGDYEFVVVYEIPEIENWVEVVEALREVKARKWITKEEPILVGELRGLDLFLI